MMRWHFDLASDIGGRAEQQDRAGVFAIPDRPNEFLLVLADGMGGERDGGLAAQAVLDTAKRELSRSTIDNPRAYLDDLCRHADQAIRQIGVERNSTPASTAVFLYIRGDEAYWAHVGDSRLYHFHADSLLSCTCDHTVAELLRDKARADVTDAIGKPADNRLYMCLGGQNDLDPEFGASAVGADDWFMLCSDGFWNQIDMDGISDMLPVYPSGRDLATDLVAAAKQRGGAHGDNVSVALATRRPSALKAAWRRVLSPRMRLRR